MVEFQSEPQKSRRPTMILATIGVLAILAGAVALYVHYQGSLESEAGPAGVAVPGLLRAGDTNFEYYKTRVLIEDVQASLGVSFSNARIAMISGVLVNDGDRTLEAVELHLTLYDAWGKISKERTAFALRPGAGYVGKPMNPLERRSFTIGVEAVEYYWDPKNITIEITGLKYS